MTGTKVRSIDNRALREVAIVHSRAFPKSALTKLGGEAVRRFYASLLSSNHDVSALGAYSTGRLIGFCFGGVFRGELSYFLAQNKFFLIRRVFVRPWLLNNSIFRNRLRLGLHFLKHPERMDGQRDKGTSAIPRSFGIQSIAVDPEFQGSGAGKLLMQAAERAARERGFERMHLTVHRENESAIGLYENLGWKKEIVDGHWNEEMRKRIVGSVDNPKAATFEE